MLLKFASLIAFDKFERFVLKKHRASLIAFDKFERFVVTTQVVIEMLCMAFSPPRSAARPPLTQKPLRRFCYPVNFQ